MERLTRTWATVSSVALLALALGGCDDTIELPNRAPAVSFGPLEAEGGALAIYYRLFDYEGDDCAVTIQACQAGACRGLTPAPGGDGLAHLPTEAGRPVLHLFVWNTACDVDAAGLAQEWTIRIVPQDEVEGPAVLSDPFRPADLGVLPQCP
jgi:hypothetical protein